VNLRPADFIGAGDDVSDPHFRITVQQGWGSVRYEATVLPTQALPGMTIARQQAPARA
jgi:hypothetical protein